LRALLDSHTFVWWVVVSRRLSAAARDAISNEANSIWVSAASAWEITTKYQLGKLPDAHSLATDILGQIADQGFEGLPISIAAAERASRLPGPHRDPFDRILIAQALADNLTVISADKVFDHYGVRRLW